MPQLLSLNAHTLRALGLELASPATIFFQEVTSRNFFCQVLIVCFSSPIVEGLVDQLSLTNSEYKYRYKSLQFLQNFLNFYVSKTETDLVSGIRELHTYLVATIRTQHNSRYRSDVVNRSYFIC